MPTIDANGETLSYTQNGEGPAVVLLHAVGANAGLWSESAAPLGGDYTLYAFDLRGHGDSTLNGALAVSEMAGDMAAAVDGLGIERFHLVGDSIGAAVAIHLATLVPGAVLSLVVCGIGLVPDQALEDEIYGIREAVHYLADEDFAEQIGEALLIPDAPQSGVDGLRASIATLGKRTYLASLEAMFESDLSGVAPDVAAPALVLHGAMEELVPLEQATALADAMPGASLTELDEAGHIAYLDNPQGFGAALAAFLPAQKG